MQFTLIDFFIGFFLMNAMPHLLFGLTGVRFLSAFGFNAAANVGYAFLNVAVALVLFHVQYGIQQLMQHGILLGAGAMLLIYLINRELFLQSVPQNKAGLVLPIMAAAVCLHLAEWAAHPACCAVHRS